jgi:hypothetical protein
LLISLVLLGALIGPFASEALHIADSPDESSFNRQQQALPAAVEALQPGQYVLVAFDYGPTTAGELNDLADAVLRDILRQRATPIILSTNPLGGINARRVMDKLARDEALLDALERDRPLRSREHYFALRYLPGGPVGIRALARNETLSATLFATDSLGKKTDLDFGEIDAADFAFVLVIGERVDDIRNWAEQFEVAGLPKYVLMTAAAEPLATAYVGSRDAAYQGYLAGYRDTYRYNRLRNGEMLTAFEPPDNLDIPDPDVSQWHSMALGALVAGVLVILGVVFNLARSLRRRRS